MMPRLKIIAWQFVTWQAQLILQTLILSSWLEFFNIGVKAMNVNGDRKAEDVKIQ